MLKKVSYVVFIIVMMVIITSCGSSAIDIWDGSVAASFAGGDGSAEKPYEISTGAELAYLAAQVNEGTSYEDTCFILTNDIDLAQIEWVPIGNGTYSFSGIFDGMGHTLCNLHIIKPETYMVQQNRGGVVLEQTYSTSGLFGSCSDASITNLHIDCAELSLDRLPMYDRVHVGVLVGYYEAENNAVLSNIEITNTNMDVLQRSESDGDRKSSTLCSGGIVGYAVIHENTDVKFDRLEVSFDMDCSSQNTNMDTNYIGSIIGYLDVDGHFSCMDFLSDIAVEFPKANGSTNYAGAFGSISIDSKTASTAELFHGYSKLHVNHMNEDGYNYLYASYAAAGILRHGKNPDQSVNGGYTFQNVFGCVLPSDDTANFNDPILQLYQIPEHALYSESNCFGCLNLPENHGFNETIWDLSDMENIHLK